VMEHLKLFVARINIPKVSGSPYFCCWALTVWCRSSKLRRQYTFGQNSCFCTSNMMNMFVVIPKNLFDFNVQTQDNAALAMIERSADAWEHNQFKDVIVRAANVEM
jgi:hypothetical protein